MNQHRTTLLFQLIVLSLLCAGSLFPQAPAWKSAGGPSGAYVQSYTIAPNGDILAGTREDGVYRSTNSGVTWSRSGNGLRYTNIYSLYTTRSGVILAGAVTYNKSLLGGTIYRSTDNGITWTSSSDLQSDDAVYSIVETTTGTLFAGTAELSTPRGVYRSTDGGIHWEQTNSGITNKSIIALLAAPGDTLFAGVGGSLYRSVNNGAFWTVLSNGLPSSTTFWSFAVDSTRAILVGTTDGVYRSTNRGASWNLSNSGLGTSFVHSFYVLPSGTITATTYGGGNFRSTDNGTSWNAANTGLADLNMKSFARTPGGTLLCGGPSGNFLSSDNGVTWTRQNGGFSSVMVHALLRHSSGALIAGTSPSLNISKDAGITWSTAAGIQHVSSLVESPSGMIFAGTMNGDLYRSADTGTTWAAANTGWPAVGINDLAVNASGHVFATNSVLFRTTDNGVSWTSSSPPGFTYLTAVEIAGNGTVYVGTNSIGIYRSSDNGTSWTSASGDLPVTGISGIFIDPQNALFAYGYGALYRSSNAGVHWTTLNNGLPKNTISSMLIDSSGHFIVGTRDSGVYFSKNQGRTWRSFRSGPFSVYSIAREPKNFILAGTKNSILRSAQPTSFVVIPNEAAGFGTVKVGETAVDSLRIENHGIEPLVIDSVWSNDPNVFSGSHPISIPVGGGAWIRSGFSPRKFGWIEGIIRISSNASTSPDELLVQGTGKAPAFASSAGTVSFGRRPINTVIDTIIRITNIGNDGLSIASVTSTNPAFGVTAFPSFLSPAETLSLSIRCLVQSTGVTASNIIVASNSYTVRDTLRLSVIGAGIPQLAFSSPQLQFGTVLLNSRKDTTIVLTNTGTDTLIFDYAYIAQDLWRLRTLLQPIPPGAQRIDTIRFVPSGIGTFRGSVIYYTNSSGVLDTLPLIGRGDTVLAPGGGFIPTEYGLSQNFPNPFNSGTQVQMFVPVRSYVTVTIFNALGQAVDTPVAGMLDEGIHQISWNPGTVSSGVYFCQFRSGNHRSFRKMLFLK